MNPRNVVAVDSLAKFVGGCSDGNNFGSSGVEQRDHFVDPQFLASSKPGEDFGHCAPDGIARCGQQDWGSFTPAGVPLR